MAELCFDLDGTLIDPYRGITRCIRYAFEEMGTELPAGDDLRWCIGPPLLGSLTRLLGGDEALGEEALKLYRDRFKEKGIFESEVYLGIRKVLEVLQRRGHRFYLVTSKPQVFAERIVHHFDLRGFFDAVYGSELDGGLSDKRELLGHVIEREGLDRAKVIMIGDRLNDFEAAKACSCKSIGVKWGYGTKEEWSLADKLVKTPDELLEAIS